MSVYTAMSALGLLGKLIQHMLELHLDRGELAAHLIHLALHTIDVCLQLAAHLSHLAPKARLQRGLLQGQYLRLP